MFDEKIARRWPVFFVMLNHLKAEHQGAFPIT
jgi:hypothetical protein